VSLKFTGKRALTKCVKEKSFKQCAKPIGPWEGIYPNF
jgi:hypothetical protein